jgi:hypothetical protein
MDGPSISSVSSSASSTGPTAAQIAGIDIGSVRLGGVVGRISLVRLR